MTLTKQMTLADYFREVYTLRRSLRANSQYQYTVAIGSLEKWSGEIVLLRDLTNSFVNGWLAYLGKSNLAPATVRNRRRHLISLWHDARQDGLLATGPGKIRAIEMPWNPPRAWTHAEVKKILAASEKLTGFYPGERFVVPRGKAGNRRIGRSVIWGLLIRVAWDCGLRTGDLLKLKLPQFQPDGCFELVQSKTLRWHATKIHPETLAAIKASYPPNREFVISWEWSMEHFRREFQLIVKAAGVSKGSFKKLRKSSATDVEKHFPGCGAAHLGHVQPGGVARAHYLDPRLLVASKPMPQPLRTL